MQAQLLVLVVSRYDFPVQHLTHGRYTPTMMSEESLGWIVMLSCVCLWCDILLRPSSETRRTRTMRTNYDE